MSDEIPDIYLMTRHACHLNVKVLIKIESQLLACLEFGA